VLGPDAPLTIEAEFWQQISGQDNQFTSADLDSYLEMISKIAPANDPKTFDLLYTQVALGLASREQIGEALAWLHMLSTDMTDSQHSIANRVMATSLMGYLPLLASNETSATLNQDDCAHIRNELGAMATENPHPTDVEPVLALLHYRCKEYTKAIEVLAKADDVHPEFANGLERPKLGYAVLAMAHVKLGQFGLAYNAFTEFRTFMLNPERDKLWGLSDLEKAVFKALLAEAEALIEPKGDEAIEPKPDPPASP